MFETLKEQVKKKEQVKTAAISISNNPAINLELFKEKIKNIDSISDEELFNIVRHSYTTMLEEVFVKNNSALLLEAFNNIRLLMVLNQVVSNVQLTPSQKIYLNRLAYDYITLKGEKNSNIQQLLFALSKTVNRNVIPGLLGIDIPEDLAAYLALARFSSSKELVNIKRVNFIIISAPLELMTEQRIVNIYEKLFDFLTPLVEGVMFDVYNANDFETESMKEIYSTISLALLDILNAAPSDVIRKVLLSYAGDHSMLYSQKPIRFSMNSLSGDYYRITQIIESLKINEQIFVP